MMIEGLNEKESEYIESMYEMMETKGWKTLEEDVGKRLVFLKDQLLNPKLTSDEIRIAQGKGDVLAELVNLKSYLNNYVELVKTQAKAQGE